MPITAKDFFEQLGQEALANPKPSKPTIVDGRHMVTEDARVPQWRKEVCDELGVLCSDMLITDNLDAKIKTAFSIEVDFLSVGGRARLVVGLEAEIRSEQLRQAAE